MNEADDTSDEKLTTLNADHHHEADEPTTILIADRGHGAAAPMADLMADQGLEHDEPTMHLPDHGPAADRPGAVASDQRHYDADEPTTIVIADRAPAADTPGADADSDTGQTTDLPGDPGHEAKTPTGHAIADQGHAASEPATHLPPAPSLAADMPGTHPVYDTDEPTTILLAGPGHAAAAPDASSHPLPGHDAVARTKAPHAVLGHEAEGPAADAAADQGHGHGKPDTVLVAGHEPGAEERAAAVPAIDGQHARAWSAVTGLDEAVDWHGTAWPDPAPAGEARLPILTAASYHEQDEPTTILVADPRHEADEPTTVLVAASGHEADEATTILIAEPAPAEPPAMLAGDGGWSPGEAIPAPPSPAPRTQAGAPPAALTAAGPAMPDYLDDEATTISAPPQAAPEPAYITELMPALPADDAADPGRPWFDNLLAAFIGGLRQDEHGQPRPPEARQALAAAARDTIARVAMQGTPGANWAADTVLQPDQLLANTYVVRALIARGGIGEIYRARHRDLKTEHAIKILLPRYALDTTMLTLMLEEARLLQCVRHEAVVGCQDLLRDTDGRPMLVMDYLRGRTLSSRLRDGQLSPSDLLALAHRLAHGLAAIHAAGIVHQDVSPDNVILAEDSCAAATIIDFGLARRAGGGRDVHRQLDFAGKFSWSSPEQLSGRPAAVDARSDLYSLGLILAAAARGYRLEMGHDLASARAARRSVPSLAGIDQPLAGLLERLLAPDPGSRLGSAAEIPALLAARRGGLWARLWK